MMISKKHTLWAPNPLLLIMMTPAIIQQTDNETFMVSASRSSHTIAEMVQTTWVTENAELEQQVQGGKELKDALARLIPDLDVSSRSRTNYGMNVRGRPLVVLVDGVCLGPSCADNRQLDSIDPFNIDRAEMIPGVTPLYDGGSTGGLVNVVVKKGQPGAMMEFKAGTRSDFNSSKGHDERIVGVVSDGNEHISGRLSVAYQKFDGWLDGNGGATLLNNTQTGLQYSDRLGIMGTGTLNIDKSRQLQLIIQHYKSQGDDDYGLDLGKGFSVIRGISTPFVNNGLSSDRAPGTERHLISLQHSDSAFLGQELVSQVCCRDESLRFYPFPTVNVNKQVTAFSSSQQNIDQYDMKLTLDSKPMDSWQIIRGLDVDHERFASNQMFLGLAQASASKGLSNKKVYTTGRCPSYGTTNLAAFLQSDYDINNPFTLSGGIHYQYTENEIGDSIGYAQQRQIAAGKATSVDAIPDDSVDYDNFLFNAGLLMYIIERQQVWLNFSRGAELPDPGKYYGCGIYGAAMGGHLPLAKSVNVSDSKLEDVKADSYELGWYFTSNNLRTQIVTCHSTSDRNVVANEDLTISMVDDKRRIYGVEGTVDYLIPDIDWSIGVNFNVLKAELKVSGTWQKYDVKTTNPSKATACIGWALDPWSLRVQSTTPFDMNDVQGYKVNGHITVDLLGSCQLPVGTPSFNIENLFNRNYTTVWRQRTPLYYNPGYGPASLYGYKGRGQTFGLGYFVLF